MSRKLRALYGLKWNPFSPEVPTEGLFVTPKIESFCWRIENHHAQEGGFALISGDPGTGKSVALRILSERLSRIGELTVGAIQHPQSFVADFYREMGDLFGVELRPHNRWAGFKALRARWQTHIESTLIRPVLLIDEAQEMSPSVLSELRILSSTHFDSRILLSVVLAGDRRLTEKLGRDDLLPLGSRIRTRLRMEYCSRDELLACMKHLLKTAGNANLMTKELLSTLCDHAAGNYRALTTMAAELLAEAEKQECAQLDEKLYFDTFPAQVPPAKTTASSPKSRRR